METFHIQYDHVNLLNFPIVHLSPCKESTTTTDMLRKSTVNDRLKRNESSAAVGGNSTNISALDRLRYNLSPVTSYYKPLIKSFSRRDESPSKVSNSIKNK